LQVDRLQRLLENFDQRRYVTIFDVDAMTGFDFEDFLVAMFRTSGYDVAETKIRPDGLAAAKCARPNRSSSKQGRITKRR
jgi:hypothetical protein